MQRDYAVLPKLTQKFKGVNMQYPGLNPIKSLIGLVVVSVLSGVAGNTAVADDPVRISVAEFSTDPNKVKNFQAGIGKMLDYNLADPMSEKFRNSLAYWSNTHGYIGTGTYATSMHNYIIGYRMPQCLDAYDKATCDAYYQHLTNSDIPNDGFTDSIWGTCQHGNLWFLPWHRFYLHYFERTVRKMSNDPGFALPYWNYYDNLSKAGLSLPPMVLTATNTLYDAWRTPGLNDGTTFMDAKNADATQAFRYDDFTNFANTLQNQPHGTMHCAVGSGCTMPDIGFVPVAGLDPAFYLHHSNIDRLWQCWLNKKANGQPIDLAWAKANLGMPDTWYEQSFKFVDENGQPVTVKVADVFSPTYTPHYDNLTNCDAKPPTTQPVQAKAMLAGAFTAQQPVAAGKPTLLGNSVVDVSLQPTPAAANLEAVGVAAPRAGDTYLVLENVRLQGSPSLTYNVLLSSKSNPKKSSYIATLSYFEAGLHGDGGALGTLTYQVTANLAELGITAANDINVRFEPTNLMTGQKWKKMREGSGVVVSNIRLQTAVGTPQK